MVVKQSVPDVLLPETQRDSALPMADQQTCHLEEKYPRIIQQLTLLWGHPELETFFEKLWIDDRGNRQGFPPEVMSELMFCSSLHRDAYPGLYMKLDSGFANRASDQFFGRRN
jgi:hypothetical protein